MISPEWFFTGTPLLNVSSNSHELCLKHVEKRVCAHACAYSGTISNCSDGINIYVFVKTVVRSKEKERSKDLSETS